MSDVNFPDYVQLWANDILTWVGFGTIVGLLAKAIMPGRDPGGSIATLGMGIGGTLIGCGVWSFFYNARVTPISPMGFAVGTAGSFIILFFYKLLGGYWFIEGESPARRYRHRRKATYLRHSHPHHLHED
ncbi:MAG: GlsB/YeaQ/YmgE family stress response membrane protein [Planctomycetes bacterium]|nr:GlsB/YeaQ/YmgE family stress response membrane protein [Planctomycetota bacterium]